MVSSSKWKRPNFSLLDAKDPTNELINKKILLYRWISPEHLELKNTERSVLEDISREFRGITSLQTPTEKITHMMGIMEKLCDVVGRTEGQDIILPSIIYCIIKSSLPNIYLEVRFMALYRRKSMEKCKERCNHGFSIDASCECFSSRPYDEKEVNYYLTSMQAAVEFIRKMEFYDLKISEGEFYENMMDAVKLVKDI